MSNNEKRIATYVDKEMQRWLSKQAQKMCLKESAFLRFLIFKAMKEDCDELHVPND
jgi:hypothetical protein